MLGKLLIVFCLLFLNSSTLGDIVMDVDADTEGWVYNSCKYSEKYEYYVYQGCGIEPGEDDERNLGYWAPCQETYCTTRTYLSQLPDDEVVHSIEIRLYGEARGNLPQLSILCHDAGCDDEQYYPINGWQTITHNFQAELTKGSQIEIFLTESEYGVTAVGMIDRVILLTSNTTQTTPTTTPQTTPSGTSTTESSSGCPFEGMLFLPHPTDCAKYYVCANGEEFISDCAAGLLFDPQLTKCNVAEEVNCVPFKCPEENGVSFHRVVGNCSKYKLCYDGNEMELECAEFTQFSQEAGKCVLDAIYECPFGTRSDEGN